MRMLRYLLGSLLLLGLFSGLVWALSSWANRAIDRVYGEGWQFDDRDPDDADGEGRGSS